MKNNKLFTIGVMALSLILASCGGGEKANDTTDTKTDSAPPNADVAETVKYAINTEKSVVKWRGQIFGIKEHTGTLKFKEGSFKASGSKIESGGLQVDMTSMAATDDNYNEEQPKEGLIGHLSSPDFFDVGSFPIASLIFLGDEGVSLSVKDKTNKEKVTSIEKTEVDGKPVFTGKLKFDRQKYGVAFTGAKDTPVSDEVELEIEIYTL